MTVISKRRHHYIHYRQCDNDDDEIPEKLEIAGSIRSIVSLQNQERRTSRPFGTPAIGESDSSFASILDTRELVASLI